jgi:hypothetical protein
LKETGTAQNRENREEALSTAYSLFSLFPPVHCLFLIGDHAMQAVDLETRMSRLEKEHHNLTVRIQKLEKQKRSSFPVFVANVVLLVSTGLLAGYLGFFRFLPWRMEQLPLQAGRVEAQEFILQDRDGGTRARVMVTNEGWRVADEKGNTVYAKP